MAIETPTSGLTCKTLERIASCLECPVEAILTGEGMPIKLTQTNELLRLWSALNTDDERGAVLAAVLETILKLS